MSVLLETCPDCGNDVPSILIGETLAHIEHQVTAGAATWWCPGSRQLVPT